MADTTSLTVSLLAAVSAAGWATTALYAHTRLRVARLDPLTGLVTRDAFRRRASRLLRDRDAYVVMVDLDHFKSVNDSFGHPAGDAVLALSGARLHEWAASHGGLAGRFGGDEFAAAALLHPDQAPAQLDELVKLLARPIHLPGRMSPITTTASIGTAPARKAEILSLSSLLAAADRGLHEAKRSGRNQWRPGAAGIIQQAPVQRTRDRDVAAPRDRLPSLTAGMR